MPATLALLVLLGGIGWALSQGLREQDSPGGQAGQTAEVPSVGGLPQEQAKQKLKASGFKVDVRSQESSAADAGNVLDQSPAAGKRAEKDSRVVIEVGNGPATVEVPDVVGLIDSEAETKLAKAGLTVGLQRERPSDTEPEGVVVEQEYPAASKVEPETAVDLRVSSGPQQAASNASNQNVPTPASASPSAAATATATASATAPASVSATASASPTAPALQQVGDNSGPGSSDGGGGG
jgi:serine/threonine-protein kinase